METKRKLASIQKIDSINSIPNADRIDCATIQGWSIIVKKGEFQIGDKCIFFEIDSILPKTTWSEFLVDKNRPEKPIRLKTRKFKGVISQGLAIPLYIVNVTGEVGDDLTEKLKILKYDPQAQEEQTLSVKEPKSKVLKYLMGFTPFRKIYLTLNSKTKGSYPIGVSKTDEENLANCYNIVSNNFDKSFYVTEKCEGSSISFFTTYERKWGINRKTFGVASRNIWLKTQDNSKYWQMAEKYKIENILKSLKTTAYIQAEVIGVGIQGNIYKLTDIQIRVFNVVIDGIRLGLKDMKTFCQKWNLPIVPIIDEHFIPSNHISSNDKATIMKWFLDYSNGTSVLYDTKREGVVVRLNDNPVTSFKVRSPNYLIEHDE